MVYKDFRDRVLLLINQYSLAGDRIEPTYNAQMDYLLRIPGLLESAQQYLATTTAPIYETMLLDWDAAEERDGFYVFQLPADFWQMCGRGVPVMRNGELILYHNYHLFGKNQLLIPARDRATMELTYYRVPHPVPSEPEDTFELDNTPAAQEAAVFYVAANLVTQDDPYIYQVLYNDFESRRLQMLERPQAEYSSIEDVFNTEGNIGVYLS